MSSYLVRFDQWRETVFSGITGAYLPIGPPFAHAMRVLHFINNTDGDIAVSFDGIIDNVPVIANTFALYDLTSDQDANESFRYQLGTQLFIKFLTAPTTGTFYVVAVFGRGE